MAGDRPYRDRAGINPPPSPIRQGATVYLSLSVVLEGTPEELDRAAGDLANHARDFASRARTTRGAKLVTGRLTTNRATTDL